MPDISLTPMQAVSHELSIVKISWHIKILHCTFLWFHPEMKVQNKSWQHKTLTSHPILIDSWITFPFLKQSFFWHSGRLFILSQQSWRGDNQLAFYSRNISNFCCLLATFPQNLFSAGEGSWRRVCTVTSCSSTTQEEVQALMTHLHQLLLLIKSICASYSYTVHYLKASFSPQRWLWGLTCSAAPHQLWPFPPCPRVTVHQGSRSTSTLSPTRTQMRLCESLPRKSTPPL